MAEIKKDIKNMICFLACYSLVREIWIIIDAIQGIENIASISDSIARTIISILICRWIVT